MWAGQLASTVGTGLATFGLSVHVFQTTGRAGALSLILFSKFLPNVYLAMFAGPLADRFDRKRILLVGQAAQVVVPLLLLAWFFWDGSRLWPAMLILVAAGAAEGVQNLVLQTTIAQFSKPSLFSRYNGVMAFVDSFPRTIAPVAAGAVLSVTGVEILLTADAGLSALALCLIAVVRFPPIGASGADTGWWAQVRYGFDYIFRRPHLLRTQGLFGVVNCTHALAVSALTAFILVESGNSELLLGALNSTAAIGGVLASLAAAVLPLNRRLVAVMLGAVLVGALGGRVALWVTALPAIWAVALFVRGAAIPMVNVVNQTLWQRVVPAGEQGRVFGARRVLGQGLYPVGLGLGGWLADGLARQPWAALPGQQSGYGLYLALVGLAEALLALRMWLSRRLSDEQFVTDEAAAP